MSLNRIRQTPIKIYYLKDQSIPKLPQKQDKLSLTYLSSFIQNDKKSKQLSKNNSLDQNDKKYTENQCKAFQYSPRRNVISSNPTQPIILKKWNQNQANIREQDQRMLGRVIGNDWEAFENNIVDQKKWKNWKANRQNIKTTSKKATILQDDRQSKIKNQKMLKEDFKIFLKNQKKKSESLKEIQISEPETFFVNTVDQKHFGKLNIFQRHNNLSFVENNIDSRKNSFNKTLSDLEQKNKTVSRNKRSSASPRIIFSSQTARSGFSGIRNFQWSKLNQANKFKLNY